MFDTSHLHPMVVHFPIALLITGFLFEIAGLVIKKEFFSKAGFYLLILGSAGVLAAYFSGQNAGSGIEEAGPLKDALEMHEDAALLAAILSGVALAVRLGLVFYKKYQGALKYVSVILFFAAVLAIGKTGYYGGDLVYKHAAGVQFDLGLGTENNTGTTQADND